MFLCGLKMSVVKSLQKVGKVTMAQVQHANGSLGGQWLSAIDIAEQTVVNNVRTYFVSQGSFAG